MSDRSLEPRTQPPRKAIAATAANWLSLAAAPAFALMAALSAFGGPNNLICTATHASQSAMTLMYLLMSAAHLPAWLRRLAR